MFEQLYRPSSPCRDLLPVKRGEEGLHCGFRQSPTLQCQRSSPRLRGEDAGRQVRGRTEQALGMTSIAKAAPTQISHGFEFTAPDGVLTGLRGAFFVTNARAEHGSRMEGVHG